ncbi:MAG: DNA polymerase ligase N-terminal domain-containing protein [Nitriliruptorales bacterium]
MADPLARYRELRDFAVTPEPAGDVAPLPDAGELPRFVIQQHDATRLHWDLRLERDGVLASWALPRGVPWSPEQRRLAVHTEDHPLKYLQFHGEIPEGEYGAGKMTIWDRGVYKAGEFTDEKVVAAFAGERIRGTYALFRLRDRDWMIHRVDPPQDPGRRPLPDDLRPMLGVPGPLPGGEGWGFEIRWAGARVLLSNDAGHVEVADSGGTEVGAAFPELRRIGRQLTAVEAVLDAVIVRVDADGTPTDDPEGMARRLDTHDDARARRLARNRPVAAMLVDVLWLEGYPTTGLAYEDRRRLLAEMDLHGPAWQVPSHHRGDGSPLLEAARARGLPGLVAKRLDSPYRPGETSDDWVVVRA